MFNHQSAPPSAPPVNKDKNELGYAINNMADPVISEQGVDNKEQGVDNKDVLFNIEEIESQLPEKKPRSHHTLIKLDKVSKSFPVGKQQVRVLKDITLNLYSGEFVIIYGPSGCGKSTLLHTVLGLEEPSRGKVYLRGKNLYSLKADDRTNYRRQKIGMMFQQSNWIKSLSVWQNVAYPLWLAGQGEKASKERSFKILEEVGMLEFAHYHPNELSGGQQQRVAVARALSAEPYILIADEPTGNLDSKTGAELIRLLVKLNRVDRRMILMVTHDIGYLPLATRRISMKDGLILTDENDG